MDWFKMQMVWGASVERLSDAEAGRFIKAVFAFMRDGKEYNGNSGREDPTIWQALETLREDVESFKNAEANRIAAENAKKQKRRDAANKRWEKQKYANASTRMHSNANASTCTNSIAFASQNKNKEKERDIDNDDDNARVRETAFGEVEADPVIISVQSNLTGLTVTHYNELAQFREILGDDLVIHAIDETVGNSARSWNYTKAILEDYVRGNVRTVGEAKERSEKRKRKQTPAQTYTQRQYSEADLEARITEL